MKYSRNKTNILTSIKLTPKQKSAVTYDGATLLVLAGAGSGKTRVLTTRYSWLVREQNLNPYNILALTFTNDAADEMRGRIAEQLGIHNTRNLWVGTFHAICARILRENARFTTFGAEFNIIDSDEQLRILKKVMLKLNPNTRKAMIEEALNAISTWKDSGISAEKAATFAPTGVEAFLPKVYEAYQKELALTNSLDFGDLILEVIKLFDANPEVQMSYHKQFEAILVDEYQDTNITQVQLIKAMRSKKCFLTAVGDDDQAIYAWRGAEIKFILEFESDFPNSEIINLSINHRSTRTITRVASQFARHIEDRRPKRLATTCRMPVGNAVRHVLFANDGAEATFVVNSIVKAIKTGKTLGTIAVLARSEWLLKPIEEKLVKLDIPVRITSHNRFIQRPEVLDMLAWLKLANNPKDDAAVIRVLKQPHWKLASNLITDITAKKLNAKTVISRLVSGPSLPPKTKEVLAVILSLMNTLRSNHKKLSPAKLVKLALDKSGYQEYLLKNNKQTEVDNIDRLVNVFLASYEKLTDFIHNLPFVDFTPHEEKDDAVQLMTAHAAKGLEFSVVFLIGWEKDIFPHSKASTIEEQRLAYVMLTRGRDEVIITSAKRRGRKYLMESPFLETLRKTNAAKNGLFVSEKA